MTVYDNTGHMTNERAKELAREIDQKVDDLLNDLFDRGMTIVEARALSSHLKAGINYITAINILQQSHLRLHSDEESGGSDE